MMKNLRLNRHLAPDPFRSFIATLTMACCLCFQAFGAETISLYVSPTGSDSNHGTSPANAFKTIEKARDTIRQKKFNQDMQGDVVVYLRGGRYELDDTLVFDNRDSGSNGRYVVYKAYSNEIPVLCGGRRVRAGSR